MLVGSMIANVNAEEALTQTLEMGLDTPICL